MRSWLRRRVANSADVEDIVQECYCRIAQLRDVNDVVQPRAYLFAVARHLLYKSVKEARVVRIEAMVDLDTDWESDEPSPERVTAARLEVARVRAALGKLTERAQRIFIMRKVEGMTQKDIALALDVSEAVVENDASRSLRAVLRALSETTDTAARDTRREGLDRVRSR